MAKDEEMLEELYELLTLYFEIPLGGGMAKSFDRHYDVEPALDRAIFREELIAKISKTIMRLMA